MADGRDAAVFPGFGWPARADFGCGGANNSDNSYALPLFSSKGGCGLLAPCLTFPGGARIEADRRVLAKPAQGRLVVAIFDPTGFCPAPAPFSNPAVEAGGNRVSAAERLPLRRWMRANRGSSLFSLERLLFIGPLPTLT